MAKKLMDYKVDFKDHAVLLHAKRDQYKIEVTFQGILSNHQVSMVLAIGSKKLFSLYPVVHSFSHVEGNTRMVFTKLNLKFVDQIEAIVLDSAIEKEDQKNCRLDLKKGLLEIIEKDGSLAKGLLNAIIEYVTK